MKDVHILHIDICILRSRSREAHACTNVQRTQRRAFCMYLAFLVRARSVAVPFGLLSVRCLASCWLLRACSCSGCGVHVKLVCAGYRLFVAVAFGSAPCSLLLVHCSAFAVLCICSLVFCACTLFTAHAIVCSTPVAVVAACCSVYELGCWR